MRPNPIVMLVALSLLSVGTANAEPVPRGNVAMYNVHYSNNATSGELHGITISFDLYQWAWDYDPETQTESPHVFENLTVTVSFPETRNDGSTIFLIGAQNPSLILFQAEISLGDVPVGHHHYDLFVDLPAMPFYCVELNLPPEYRTLLNTETAFCPPADNPV